MEIEIHSFKSENLNEVDHFGTLGTDWRKLLKWIL